MRFLKVFFVSLLLAPTVALACGNEVQLSTDDQTKAVAKAEKLLESGEYGKAVKSLIEAAQLSPMNFRFQHVFTNEALRGRAQRVAAVAAVRGKGKVSLTTWGAKLKRGGDEAARQLKWAVEHLEKEHTAKPDDPAVASLFGEGLTEAGRIEEARKILEDLATRDLMTDAFGWLALAKLRAAANDAAGRDVALEKCRQSAVKPALCILDPGAGKT